MINRAVILCGGKGKRLRPYTHLLPKPLMPIGEIPILEIVVRQLIYFGLSHITLAVNHQANVIKSFFGNGSKWNIKIDYSFEDKQLSTMAPLKLINDLPNNFLVMNADILTDLNYGKLIRFHERKKNLFTISSKQRVQDIDYGVLKVNKMNELMDFTEKPQKKFIVSMGIYVINKKVLKYIPNNKKFGFDDLMLKLLKNKIRVNIKNHNKYWLDIGRPEDYSKAIKIFEDKKNIFLHD